MRLYYDDDEEWSRPRSRRFYEEAYDEREEPRGYPRRGFASLDPEYQREYMRREGPWRARGPERWEEEDFELGEYRRGERRPSFIEENEVERRERYEPDWSERRPRWEEREEEEDLGYRRAPRRRFASLDPESLREREWELSRERERDLPRRGPRPHRRYR